MNHNALRKAVVALVLYGAPLGSLLASSPAAAGESHPDFTIPSAWLDAANHIRGTSGYELLARLETIAASPEFWAGLQSFLSLLSQEHLDEVDGFIRTRKGDSEFFLVPGVPSRIEARAYYATVSVFSLLPEQALEVATTAALNQKTFDGESLDIRRRWHDPLVPVEVRSLDRRAGRGVVALMLKAISDGLDDATTTELLTIYAEGMESLAQLVALNEQVDPRKAAQVLDDLRLPRLDRDELDDLTKRAAEARKVLATSADALDGKPLELPPDPSFRS